MGTEHVVTTTALSVTLRRASGEVEINVILPVMGMGMEMEMEMEIPNIGAMVTKHLRGFIIICDCFLVLLLGLVGPYCC